MDKRVKHQRIIKSKKVMTPAEEKALESFLERALVALDREDVEQFVLNMHKNHADISYFQGKDRKEVEAIFATLTKDTKHHAELMEHVVKLCD